MNSGGSVRLRVVGSIPKFQVILRVGGSTPQHHYLYTLLENRFNVF